MDLHSSRVVLVTGASSGIGRACAPHLGQGGDRLYGTSRRAQADAGAGAGATAFAMIQMDVDDRSSVERGIDHILECEGRLDVVVNNAGIALAGALEDIVVDEAKALLEAALSVRPELP